MTHKGRAKAVEPKAEEPVAAPFSIDALVKTLHEQAAEEWSDDLDMHDSFESLIEQSLSDLVASVRDHTIDRTRYNGMVCPRLQIPAPFD